MRNTLNEDQKVDMQIEISNILNGTNAYEQMKAVAKKYIGVEIHNDSEIFADIESYIVNSFHDCEDIEEEVKEVYLEGIRVKRLTMRDTDSVKIIALDEDGQRIASGHYNIMSNTAHVDIEINNPHLEDFLVEGIESRTIKLN
jgi:hypothetical protein